MIKMMKNSLALIALLLATTAAVAQVPVLKKPVLAPQVKPALPPAILKTPITVVNAASITSSSPNREEAARRLKAQNVPVAAALAALRNAFDNAGNNILALRTAGYTTPELMITLKQADSLSAVSMLLIMEDSRVPAAVWTTSIRQLYTLDFDALLADLRRARPGKEWFGTALYVMGYNVQQMAQTGYRHFNGGFRSPADNDPAYPSPGKLYSALMYEIPIAQNVQINVYSLWVKMMSAGYSPSRIMSEIKMGTYDQRGMPTDDVSRCVAQTNLVNDGRRPGSVNPALVIHIAPDGSASHSDVQRGCYVRFLKKLKDQGASLAFARQLAEYSVVCIPEFNPGCPARVTEVAALMVTEAEYPAEKN